MINSPFTPSSLFKQKELENALFLVNDFLSGKKLPNPQSYAQALMASLLIYATHNSEEIFATIKTAYPNFEKACPLPIRREMAQSLAHHIHEMKLNNIALWEPFFTLDTQQLFTQAAAHAAATLGKEGKTPLSSCEDFCDYIITEKKPELLTGLFLTCDLRLLPLLEKTWDSLREKGCRAAELPPPCLSSVALEFYVRCLEKATQADDINALSILLADTPTREAKEAPFLFFHNFPDSHPDYEKPQVIDAVSPLPSWKFPETPPQVIHTWTCPEYLPRFLPRITEKLTDKQREQLCVAWKNPRD